MVKRKDVTILVVEVGIRIPLEFKFRVWKNKLIICIKVLCRIKRHVKENV